MMGNYAIYLPHVTSFINKSLPHPTSSSSSFCDYKSSYHQSSSISISSFQFFFTF
ncbi:hypothetical protein HanXRQr2_Chr04g0167051 [Helianthus annuus]|uniref:Uncharacterized protein n=1 Tax=Helianthus annuus TaxID=4232 RepID=A0A251UZB3_HELAN|nr:hypothetical protein HanXRQr2_Chr04g0167051 [Helianthus annuus]KAJ0931341.1 hypothetical protein HanPSC8_Chr04g0160531 [Helianthus annuus]